MNQSPAREDRPVPTTDPVGLTLASVGAGAAVGATVLTVGVIVLRTLQRGVATRNPDVEFIVLSTSLVFGIILAVATTIVASRPIRDTWRRSVAGVMAVFATALLSAVTPLGEIAAGRVGLVVYAVLLALGAGYCIRFARRAARQ